MISPELMARAHLILDEADIPELPNHYRGKVRDNYDLPDGRRILIATDRLSAFDIALAAIPKSALWIEAITLAIVGIGITGIVYGSVALIVKMDDVGLFLAKNARLAVTRALGRGLVRGMPLLMEVLSTIGTAAMLWVGGSILTHGAEVLGWTWPYHTIETIAHQAAALVPQALTGAVAWIVTAALDGIIGVIIGMTMIPLVTRLFMPVWQRLAPAK